MKKRLLILLPLLLVALASSSRVDAVSTSHWVQQNEADFKPGTFHNVVVNNLGDLKLSRAVTTLLDQNPKASAVFSLAETPDGTIYAGTGPQGVLLAVHGDKVETAATLSDDANIFSLLALPDGKLLLGTGGSKGRIYQIDSPGKKPRVLFEADGVQYVWAMARTPDGNLYAATGPTGKLFEIKPDGSHSILLDTTENNLLSLVSDGKNLLYVGTDPNGLVYRVNRKTHESFVLYDAAESEISALALDPQGNLYVGTAEASEPAPGGDDTAATERAGRPEGGPGGVPIEGGEPPAALPPTTPAPTNPNPGTPAPVPQASPPQIPPSGKPFAAHHHPGATEPLSTPLHLDLLQDDPNGGGGGGGDGPAPADPSPGPGPGPGPGNPPKPAPGAASKPAAPPQQGIDTTGTGQPAAEGNAIYKIDPRGFVTEIFRQPVLVLSMIEHDGVLLVATGSEGLVYQVNPAADETAVIAKVDPKQVTALLPTHDGRIILGLANVGGLASMGAGYADTGTYLSPVQDATQISTFGKIALHGLLPADTSLTVSSRSGNMHEPTDTGWSKWSDESPAAAFVTTSSPPARYFQYRLTFSTKNAQQSPLVEDADVAYLSPNLPPEVKGIKIALGSKTAPPPPPPGTTDADHDPSQPTIAPGRIQTITWDASDPNDDPLMFTLCYRKLSGGPWILLKDRLKDPSFEWDTRTVADGRYEVKVTASDAAANPVGQGKTASRVSDPMVVDNTPPAFTNVRLDVHDRSLTVSVRTEDATSIVSAIDYSIDGAPDWQSAAATDRMFDSPVGSAAFTVENLPAGQHQITVRSTDARGNQGYVSPVVTIGPPTTVPATTEPAKADSDAVAPMSPR